MLPWPKVVLGTVAFTVFWLTAVFNSLPILPIGRTAGAIVGAMLMVIFQIVTPTEAYDSIDLPVLGLLFGTMVVSIYLERVDAFKHLGKALAWRSMGPRDLLTRICLVSGTTSAFFTNDTCCTVLTGFVLRMTREHNLPPHPFLIALATSANIGSSATPIGNPQNLVIATKAGISFRTFLAGVLPASILGLIVNTFLLQVVYWRDLSPEQHTHHVSYSALNGHSNSESTSDCLFSKKNMWTCSVYTVTIAMMVALVMGLNMSWTALTAAFTMVILDFTDAYPSLEKVSYSLLVFFCGMFMTMHGLEKTGIPSSLWALLEPYSPINTITGLLMASFIIVVLCNLISNVPAVLLIGSRMAASAALISTYYEKKAWLVLALVSTVAGNLTLLGSAANMIVCEQASRNQVEAYDLTVWTHLKFGLPSTIIVIAASLFLVDYF